MIKLVHVQSGEALADRLEIARTAPERMRGLLGRGELQPGGGMLLERCSSIHTFFMKFPLDLIFLDAGFSVRKTVRNLSPWRMAMSLGAKYTVELPAGTLERVPVGRGDLLTIEEHS